MSEDNNPKRARALLDGKAPMELIPYGPLAAVARVLQGGADKYGKRNWREEPIAATTYIGAINRHTNLEWAEGIDEDHDSGEHPLAHVIASCLLVMDAEKHGTLIDDRGETEVLGRETPPDPFGVDDAIMAKGSRSQRFEIVNTSEMCLHSSLEGKQAFCMYDMHRDQWHWAEGDYDFWISPSDWTNGYVEVIW